MEVCLLRADAYTLYDRLCSDMRAALTSEEGPPVILLVPGQLTLESELTALSSAGRTGSFRLQVLSLRRLCDKILACAGGGLGSRIDEIGRACLMRRALSTLDTRLTAFETARNTPGFAALAAQAVWQWKEAGLRPKDVQQVSRERAGTPLGDKLQDIAQLYTAWQEQAKGIGLDEEDLRIAATERVGNAPFLQGAQIWVYGFDLLSVPLSRMLCALGHVCSSLQVLLPLSTKKDDARLYAPIQRTYTRLTDMLTQAQLRYKEKELPPASRPSSPVRTLSERLFSYPVQPQEEAPAEISLYAAHSPQDEAEHIAAGIRHLLRKQGFHYGDIAIACDDEQSMAAIRRAFALYNIPVFFPESRQASAHPLCATLLAALRLPKSASESDAQTILSSGYSGLTDEEADSLRLWAEEKGITGWKWLRPSRPGNDPTGSNAQMELLRQKAFSPVTRLAKDIAYGSTDERLEAVYRYLAQTGAYARMCAYAQALAEAGEPVLSAESTQAWAKINEALDRLSALYSGSPSPASAVVITELLEQSFSVTEVKPLPQSADAVFAGALSHMKTRPVRLLVIAGAIDSDDAPPAGMLSDSERDALAKTVWLGPGKAERTQMRMVAAKATLSFAQELLWISWTTASADGAVRRPGALVRSVRSLFPHLSAGGGVTLSAREQALRLMHPTAALAHAGEALRKPSGPTDAEKEALRALSRMPAYATSVQRLRKALSGDQLPEKIAPQTAKRLYNGPVSLSITRLELFARCPFSHFVQYGARPKRLQEYGVTPLAAGSFVHEALELFVQRTKDLPDEAEAARRMDAITEELVSTQLTPLAEDGAVYAREVEELCAVARRAARIHIRHRQASAFAPVAAESPFGQESGIPLRDATLAGIIDRIDSWQNGEQRYLCIVDYKRGGRTPDFAQMLYGLQLQLPVYLLAAERLCQGQSAAALYETLSDPLVDTPSTDPDQVERQRAKQLRLEGLMLSEPEVVQALSDPPDASLHVLVNADGTLRKNDRLLSKEDLALLTQNAIAQAEEGLTRIRGGVIAPNPVYLDGYSPCPYCPYSAVCRTDAATQAQRYRVLAPRKAQEVLSVLRGEKPDP